MSKQSIHFEETSGQYAKISNADQTDLGLESLTSFRIDVHAKIESLPSTGSTYFGLCGKYDSASANRGWTFDIRNDDKLGFLYSETPGGGGYNWKISSSPVITTSDLDKWIKFTAEVTPGTQSIVLKKDDVTLSQSSVLSGGTSIATTTTDFTIGKANGSPTADSTVSLVEIWDTSSGSDVLVERWEFQGNVDSFSGLNDLTAVNSPTYVNDHYDTDISEYGTTQDTDWFEIETDNTKIDGNYTDFVYPLRLDTLPSAFFDLATDGTDIRITNEAGTIQYPSYVVWADEVAEDGLVYFKDDTSSSTNKKYRVYRDGISEARDDNALYGRNQVANDMVRAYFGNGSGTSLIDASGNQDGIKKSTTEPTESTSEFLGISQHYDNVDDYVEIGGGSELHLDGNQFEATTLFEIDAFGSATNYDPWLINFWDYDNVGGATSFLVAMFDESSTRKMRLLTNGSGGVDMVESATTLVAGTEYKVTAGYDGTNLYIQVNDETRVTTNIGSVTFNNITTSDPACIGGRKPSSSFEYTLDGKMAHTTLEIGNSNPQGHSDTQYRALLDNSNFWSYNAGASGTAYTQEVSESLVTIPLPMFQTNKSFEDGLVGVDSYAGQTVMARIYTEVVSLVDSISNQLVYVLSVIDSVLGVDTHKKDITVVNSETSILQETTTTQNILSKIYTETSNLVDNVSSNVVKIVELLESVTLVDSIKNVTTKVFSDVVDATEEIVKILQFNLTVSETTAPVDTAIPTQAKSLTDSANLNDITASLIATLGILINETMQMVDDLVGYLNGENMKYIDQYEDSAEDYSTMYTEDSEVYVDKYHDN